MREFAFANVPSSWLGRGWSRLGSRLRVTICTAAPEELGAPAKSALDARLPKKKSKSVCRPRAMCKVKKVDSKTLKKTTKN